MYNQHYGLLWSVRACLRVARVTFYIFTRKRRCLDRFFASFLYPTSRDYRCKTNRLSRPVVWYGSGGFSTHSRGTDGRAVPVKYIRDVCKLHYETLPVVESMTSQMHSVCQRRMAAVQNRRGETIRGLYWCGHCKKLVQRDPDACRCIKDAALAMERPGYLVMGNQGPKPQPVVKLPRRRH